MIDSSIPLMVTGSSLMPSTHDASHGAGHNRPVHSGKLFVACRRSIAVCQRFGRPDRSSRESDCRAGSPGGRTECCSPCSARPVRATATRASAGRPLASRAAVRRRAVALALARSISRNPRDVTHAPPRPVPRTPAPDARRARAPRPPAPACSRAASPSRTACACVRPVVEQPLRVARCRCTATCRSIRSRTSGHVAGVVESSRSTIARLQRAAERSVRVEHVRDAAAHAGGEVAPRPAQHDDAPAGHVLAAVIADALDHRRCAPLLRTAKRSPARPRTNASPPVAPYSATLPMMTFSSGTNVDRRDGNTDQLAHPTAPCRSSRWHHPRGPASCPCGMNAPKLWPADPSK